MTATAEDQSMTITRRTLGEAPSDVEITAPDGTVTVVPLEEVTPGRYSGTFDGPEIGLYRLVDDAHETVVALGPSAPREFEETIATDEILADAVDLRRGGSPRIEDGMPGIRTIREGRVAAGRGWIGITPRNAFVTADVTVIPLIQAWLFLLIAAALIVGAWLREGRRT